MGSAPSPLAESIEAPPMIVPWPDAQDVKLRAGFMGRRGGVSCGVYASFNLAHWIGDDPAAVTENWRRWRTHDCGLRPALLSQVHGTEVIRVHAGDAILVGERPRADGMVTTEPGIALGVFSADCVPILLYDDAAQVVAALHAGWRGTLAGIAVEGIRAMIAGGARPDRIRTAAGPAIGPCCFEVDAELAEQFTQRILFAHEFTRPGKRGKAYLDLRGIIRRQLEEAGLNPRLITAVGPCIRCHPMDYFSRRAAAGAITGLQMSFIALNQSSNA
jgi:YfiH family protein